MISLKKMNAKCNIRINKYKKQSALIPKSSASFVWKDTNWKKIELCLNILQNKIYAAKKEKKYQKSEKTSKIYNNDIEYWSRRAITPDLKSRTKDKLLKRQNYKCSICKKFFLPSDIIETDHIISIVRGGSHKITNLQLLHAVCHDRKKNIK